MSLGTSEYEFLGIINLMSSATIFSRAHIAILLLSFYFFYQSSYYNVVVITAFLWHILLLVPILYYFLLLVGSGDFCGLAYVLILLVYKFSNGVPCLLSQPGPTEGCDLPSLSICGQPRLIFPLPYVLQSSGVLEASP